MSASSLPSRDDIIGSSRQVNREEALETGQFPGLLALPSPCLVLDEHRRIRFANPAARREFALDVIPTRTRCCEAVHPQEGVRDDCPLTEVLTTGRETEREIFEASSGQWRRYGVYPLRNCGGESLYLHTFDDVSSRVAYETEILRLNRALRTLTESNQALLRTEDEQELMNETCRIAVEVGGFHMAWVGRAEDDPGRTITPVAWSGFNPEVLGSIQLSWAYTAVCGQGPTGTAIRTGRPIVVRDSTEFEMPTSRSVAAEDKAEHASAASFPLLVEGRVFGALTLYAAGDQAFLAEETSILTELAGSLAFGIDSLRTRARNRRTEIALAESEERYRSLVESAPLGIMVHTQGRITYANQAAIELVGARTGADLLGRHVADFLHPDCRIAAERRIARMMRTGLPTPTFEETIQRMDGEMVRAEVTGVPLIFEGQTSVLALIQDDTERRRIEKALCRSEEQLRQSQKLETVGRLAGGIAHDFNNLLTIVTGSAELLHSRIDDPPPEVENDIEEIRSAAKCAADLTRQLLALSRQQSFRPRVVDVNTVVVHIDRLLRRTLGDAVLLEIDLEEDLEPIEIDPSRLEQILLNLAVNARDAMDGRGRLLIETANTDDGRVGIEISDNGAGMDEHVKARIFEPFYSTKEKGKGSGLGLSTVYGIVEQSEGDIRVESRPSEGTRFIISFPRSRHRVDWQPHSEPQSPADTNAKGMETVLVVEDEKSVRALAGRVLEGHGYRVLAAESAEEAVVTARNLPGQIHLLLTDVVLPRMSGHDLAEVLSAEQPDINVLLMSGCARDTVLHEGRNTAAGFLEKPFRPQDLALAVREALDRKEPQTRG